MQDAVVDAKIARLGRVAQLRAELDAEEVQLLADLHAADPSGKEYLREEVALAVRWSHEMTRDRMREAVVLTRRFPATVAAMREGTFGYWYAHSLADLTRHLSDKAAARRRSGCSPRRTGGRALSSAGRSTVLWPATTLVVPPNATPICSPSVA